MIPKIINNSLKKKRITKQFLLGVGSKPNFDNPESFNEKVQWLKLHYRDPLMTKCSDKYLVRDYVASKIGRTHLTKCLGVYDKAKDIHYENLPNCFVLKVNHGSGTNIFCRNKKTFDVNKSNKQLNEWMKPKNNHYYFSYEWAYKDIKPLIIAEEYLKDHHKIVDYKFMCFNGKPQIVFTAFNRGVDLKINFFDMNWNHLNIGRNYAMKAKQVEKPSKFNEMIKISKKLSEPFPFVRVDLYEIKSRIFFGELTFYPSAGIASFYPNYWDLKLGELLELPTTSKKYQAHICK